jgi:hypothetical protein
LLFVAGGYWRDSTVDKQSVIILKANIQDLDFSAYTCGLNIRNIQTWDTTYYSAGSVAPTVTSITTVVGGVTAMVASTHYVTGTNYPNSIWPLMPDVSAASLYTISFDVDNTARKSIGAEQIPNF